MEPKFKRSLKRIGVIVPALLLAAGLWQADAQTSRHMPALSSPYGFHHAICYAGSRILIYTNHAGTFQPCWIPYLVYTNSPVRTYMAQAYGDFAEFPSPYYFTVWIQPSRVVTVTAFSGEMMFCATNPPGNQYFRGVQFPITTNLWRVDSTPNLSSGFQTTVGYAQDASTLAINQTAVVAP